MSTSSDDGACDPTIPAGVCAAWFGDRALEHATCATPGFSGATVRFVRPAGWTERFVLKRFRPGTPLERAAWVHRLMHHAKAAGVAEVPELLVARSGSSLVTGPDGIHWEVARFVPGLATDAPAPAQAVAAVEVLARFHRAAVTLPGGGPARGPAPAVERRIDQARRLRDRPWLLRRRSLPGEWPAERRHPGRMAAVLARWDRAIATFAFTDGPAAVETVAGMSPAATRLQPVMRDIWSDHVLFDEAARPRVAGIVDFHAAAIDAPATDLARLLGSWRTPAGWTERALPDRWPGAIDAYDRLCPLEDRDRQRIGFLHAAGVLCGLDNWFRWIVEEGRDFAGWEAALARIDRHLEELPDALRWLARGGWDPV